MSRTRAAARKRFFTPLCFLAAIQNHRPGSLKHAETIEKNHLPGKEEIEAERRASVSDEK